MSHAKRTNSEQPYRYRCAQCGKELADCPCVRCGWCKCLIGRVDEIVTHLNKPFHTICWFTLEEASRNGVLL